MPRDSSLWLVAEICILAGWHVRKFKTERFSESFLTISLPVIWSVRVAIPGS
jgi:hypothetical protein